MTGRKRSGDSTHQPRRDSMYEERVRDSYQAREKLPEPTVCPDCGAIFAKGRWQWGEPAHDANKHRCPACRRIQERVPAAYLTLGGDFFEMQKDEIMRLVHNKEEMEIAQHPLERIMSIEQQNDSKNTVISYTSVHLAKSTGDALSRAYQGDFYFKFTDKGGVLMANWRR